MKVHREINHLVEQLMHGNVNPGSGNKSLFKGVINLRGDNGARIFLE